MCIDTCTSIFSTNSKTGRRKSTQKRCSTVALVAMDDDQQELQEKVFDFATSEEPSLKKRPKL